MYEERLFSQASTRAYRIFRDQHGREWGADIETKTQAPCGPYSPRFKAPLMPPQKYIDLVDRAAGRVEIAYDRWLEDEDTARQEYTERLRQQAYHLYRDKAADALADPPPDLIARVGRPPEDRRRILAARAGDPWVLGLSQDRPKWADLVFPRENDDDELAFMREDTSFMEEDEPEPEVREYPYMKGPGLWVLSDGSTVRGKRVDAEAAEAELHEPAGAGAVDPSWG